MSEGDAHTVRRLEAFSDIVIGFCIAEMGVNLLIPKTAAEFSSIGPGTVGFAVSFVLIAIVWWIHQRLFKTFFTLSTLTVVMNVAMLGSLVLMVYFQQISLHFIVTEDRPTAAVQLWLVSYGVVYALLAGMLWIGLRDRWATLAVADLRWGLSRAILASVGTLIFLSNVIAFANNAGGRILILVPLVAIVALRLALPRIVDRLIARRAESPQAAS